MLKNPLVIRLSDPDDISEHRDAGTITVIFSNIPLNAPGVPKMMAKIRGKAQELMDDYTAHTDPSSPEYDICRVFYRLIDWCRDEFGQIEDDDIVIPQVQNVYTRRHR